MAIKLYMDVHIPYAITVGLRVRKVDVITAQEDGTIKLSDSQILDRATQLGRVVVSFDDDFLIEASYRQQRNIPFSGVIYGHQLNVTIGSCVKDLEIIAKIIEPADLKNRIEFLPL